MDAALLIRLPTTTFQMQYKEGITMKDHVENSTTVECLWL